MRGMSQRKRGVAPGLACPDTELVLCPGDGTRDLPAHVGLHAQSVAKPGSFVSGDLAGAPLTD